MRSRRWIAKEDLHNEIAGGPQAMPTSTELQWGPTTWHASTPASCLSWGGAHLKCAPSKPRDAGSQFRKAHGCRALHRQPLALLAEKFNGLGVEPVVLLIAELGLIRRRSMARRSSFCHCQTRRLPLRFVGLAALVP